MIGPFLRISAAVVLVYILFALGCVILAVA